VIGTTYEEWGLPIEIRKSNGNFKYRKPKYFNCEIYEHIARDCKKPKKKKDTQKSYEYRRTGYITKDCRIKQKIKKWNVQEDKDIDIKEENKQKGFEEDSE